MAARIIDGKAVAAELREEVVAGVAALVAAGRPAPGLAVVLVGEDPASRVYVTNKLKQTEAVGMRSDCHLLPADTTDATLLALIETLNANASVDGILVQFPLPPHLDTERVVSAIAPHKDVDGFNPLNVGRVASGATSALTPCTPLGIMRLIGTVHEDVAGLEAVVVGASNVVGRPMARLLLQAQSTVAIAHIRTADLARVCRGADILVTATGVPGLIRREHVKPGATVIDVGITRIRMEGGRERLVGDVAFDEVREIAGAITPVPGGVGPMTIACLLANTLSAARQTSPRPVIPDRTTASPAGA